MARKLDGIGKMSFAIAVALFVVVYFALKDAFGADKYQVFPLNKPIPERALICLEKDIAIRGVKLAAAGDEIGVAAWQAEAVGKCAPVAAEITYRKRVHFQDVDGVPYTVYEAEIQGVTVYVPMMGFRHDHPV